MYVTLWSYPLNEVPYCRNKWCRGWSGWDRDAIHPVTRHCTIKMILKLLFQEKKSYIIINNAFDFRCWEAEQHRSGFQQHRDHHLGRRCSQTPSMQCQLMGKYLEFCWKLIQQSVHIDRSPCNSVYIVSNLFFFILGWPPVLHCYLWQERALTLFLICILSVCLALNVWCVLCHSAVWLH